MPGAVWLRDRPPRRRSGGLTRTAIAEATVAALDRDGPAGLSLRGLAGTLGVHATSLYWHVATRDDLLDLALDAVFGELALPGVPSTTWDDEVRLYMHELRGALLRHPWSGALATSRPLLGPEALARSEFVHAALTRAGLAGPELTAAAAAVSNLVISSVAAEAAWRHDGEAAARAAMHEHLRRHADRYPTLAALPANPPGIWTDQFSLAVEMLLAGIRHRLAPAGES
ncbi:TetR/AcrR family transcriptional regulator [Actinomadura sp. 7K507]|nr:TetR/AcrR family transcriptional regulator [Actinomadura sp. 7K507]